MAFADALIYGLPQENLVGPAYTGTAPTYALGSGTLAAGYTLADLFTLTPAKGVKFTGGGDVSIEITFPVGAPQAVYLAALFHPNWTGNQARIQSKHSSGDAWGSVVDQILPTFAADAEGYRGSSWRDLTATHGSDRFWRLLISGVTDPALGALALFSAYHRFDPNYDWGFKTTPTRPGQAVLASRYGVESIVRASGPRRQLAAQISSISDAGLINLVALDAACAGRALATVIIPRPSGTVMPDRQHDAWLVRADQDLPSTGTFLDANDVPLSWTEVANGRAWA